MGNKRKSYYGEYKLIRTDTNTQVGVYTKPEVALANATALMDRIYRATGKTCEIKIVKVNYEGSY